MSAVRATDALAVLQLSEGATPTEIKAAYRRLVALYHPDNNPGFPAEATQKVRELNDAYAALRDGRVANGASAGASGARGADPRTPPPMRPRHANPPRQWDPPQPPPKASGPQVPPLRYADVPPPRTGPPAEPPSEEALAAAARRAALVDALGSVTPAHASLAMVGPPASDDPLVGVLLDLDPGTDVRCAVPYAELTATGPVASEASGASAETTHVAPSFQIGGTAARSAAIERFALSRYAVVVGDTFVWTASELDDGGDILIREHITAYAVPRAAIVSVRRGRGELCVDLGERGSLDFAMGRAEIVALGGALGLRTT